MCYFIVVKGHSLLSPENFEGNHMVFRGKVGGISHRRQSFGGAYKKLTANELPMGEGRWDNLNITEPHGVIREILS